MEHKTSAVLLKLRQAGWEFDRENETHRHYVMTKEGHEPINVPKREELDPFAFAEILRNAGLLLMVFMLAGLSTLAEPAERVDPGPAVSSMPRLLQ